MVLATGSLTQQKGSVNTVKYGIVEHAYETLISKALFQQVQDVINGYHKTPHKMAIKPFIFKGLITCADCGCVCTPEIHKKRYVYYSCTNAKKSL